MAGAIAVGAPLNYIAMDANDAFFTHSIVGAPFTVLLGRRLGPVEARASGIDIDLPSGQSRLGQAWQEWALLSPAITPAGQPRRRPGRWRQRLERHALWLAVLGLASLLASAIAWGWLLWT